MSATRRDFLKVAGAGAVAAIAGSTGMPSAHAARTYGISLAAYSLHRTIGKDGIPMLELPRVTREEFGLDAVELVNWMLASDEPDYLSKFSQNAAAQNVKVLLIMVDRAGSVGASSENARATAVERHGHWIDIAADMGCHSIRMNWAGARSGTMDDPQALDDFVSRSVAPLRAICDHGDRKGLNVIIENHGGPSSHPDTLLRLIREVDHERFGTLPDFGNFPPRVNGYGGPETVDLYEAVDKMMPHAHAVSAKCYDFDAETGEETSLDYSRLIEIVADRHGYTGYIGIEYEGVRLAEFEGVHGCKKLLDSLRTPS